MNEAGTKLYGVAFMPETTIVQYDLNPCTLTVRYSIVKFAKIDLSILVGKFTFAAHRDTVFPLSFEYHFAGFIIKRSKAIWKVILKIA